MTKEQYEALMGKIDSLGARLEKLSTQEADLAAAKKDASATAGADSGNADPAADPQFAALHDGIGKLAAQLGDIAAKFESAKSGTFVPPNTAPAGVNGVTPLI